MLAPSAVSVEFSRSFTLPELARQGFQEGRNLRFVVRDAGGRREDLPRLAAELSAERCDVVVAVAPAAIAAAREAMPATSIVMGFGDDPVGRGWAASLQRPGGRVTGVSMQASEGELKRIELVTQLMPGLRRLGVLVDPGVTDLQRRALREATDRLGLTIVTAEAAHPQDFERAFAALRRSRAEAVLVTANPVYLSRVGELARIARASGLPMVCEWKEMARAGCVAGFGPVIAELRTRVGAITAQILRGARPADIPIEQPVRFELTLNLAAARALGMAIPSTMRLRADEVIE